MRTVLKALTSHWRRHPVELATLLLGLMVATALWSGVQALNAEARASYARAAALLGGDRLERLVATGAPATLSDFAALRRAGWPASPVLEGAVVIGETRLQVIGVEPLTLPPGALSGPGQAEAFLAPEGLGLVAPDTAATLAGAPGLPPLEASEAVPPGTILLDIGPAERLLGRPGAISHFLLGPGPRPPLPEALAGRFEVRAPEGTGEFDRLTDSFHLNLTAFGFLSFVVGLFIVYAAIGLAFEQRRPMLRTLRACGVPARTLTLALLAELGLIALVAGAAGVALGYLLAAALLPDVAASLRGLYGAPVQGSLGLSPSWWAAGLAMAALGALGAGAGSLWRAFRLPLLATAQPEAWRGAEARRLRLQTGAAALLALAGLALLAFGRGLEAGFAVMGCLLLAAALALPALLAAVLTLAARTARGPIAQWAWADARQQLPGLSLALMALLIALAVNVGVGTMVESFRQTFLGWLDQRLSAEVYVGARDPAQATAIAAWLNERPEVLVLPILDAETEAAGWSTEVYGFTDDPTYRDSWPVLTLAPGGWDSTAAGEAVLVSEQLARRAGLATGDPLTLTTPTGPWQTVVAGVYPDYGNPAGQVMAGAGAMAARWPDAPPRRFALRLPPAEAPALVADVRTRFEGATAIDQAALKEISTGIFERTFAVTIALNALTLSVAGIALFTSLLTLAGLRLAQAAPVWALGLTRRHLARIELARALALATLTALAALPVGLAVAWVLTTVVNVEAFGWRLPIHVFPGQWARLLALALATALAAAAWPAWRLGRAHPLDLLRSFSNER